MGTSDQYKVFDSILDWSPTLSIVLGPPGVPISLKSVFLETPCISYLSAWAVKRGTWNSNFEAKRNRLFAELENVKSFTRTNINKPDFTPRKARKSRHFWHFKPTKQNLWGFLWWVNVDKLSIYGSLSIDLNFLHISSQKWLVFANYFGLPNFLPQLANFFTRIYPSYPWHFPTLHMYALLLVVITFSKADGERLRIIKRELRLTSDYYKSD